eukprot:331704_1
MMDKALNQNEALYHFGQLCHFGFVGITNETSSTLRTKFQSFHYFLLTYYGCCLDSRSSYPRLDLNFMTPTTITFIFWLFIFRTQLAKDLEISTCDKICITNSLRSDLEGTYHFKYFNSTLNGGVYHNSENEKYLHPYKSSTKYQYLIQSYTSITTDPGASSSSCEIGNLASGYTFDPYDCFNGWRTYDSTNDEWNDDPNQRLVNCNDVTVSGNYRSGLDGTYEWLKFNIATIGSVYQCKHCDTTWSNHNGFYLFPCPDGDSLWKIGEDYSSTTASSYGTCSSGLPNRALTMDDCEWYSWISNGSAYNWMVDPNLAVESDKCAYTVSTSSFPIYTIILGIICALFIFILTSVRQKQNLFTMKTNIPVNVLYITISVLVFNTLLLFMMIVAAEADSSWRDSESRALRFFVWPFTPIFQYVVVFFMETVWFLSHMCSTKNFRKSGSMNRNFCIAMLLVSFASAGTFTACYVNGAQRVSQMMCVYCLLSLLMAIPMAYDWHHLKMNKNLKTLQQPLIHQNEQLQHSTVQLQHEQEELRRKVSSLSQCKDLDEFRWEWKDNTGDWHPYGEQSKDMIEYLDIGQQYAFTLASTGYDYVITKKSTSAAKQLNKKTNKWRQVRRVNTESLNTITCPAWWAVSGRQWVVADRSAPNYAKTTLVSLDLNTYPANKVVANFKKTVTNRRVVKVESVENRMLYESYWSAKRKLTRLVGERKINERFVFHGTNNLEAMKRIQTEGFRKEFTTRAAYGEGTYFARDASYSVQYTGGINRMFQCNVVMGQSFRGKAEHRLRSWPRRKNELIYDSLVDNQKNPSIFVIHENDRAYPMFIVHFR